MPLTCVVPNCRTETKRNCGISFFQFPNDVGGQQRWVKGTTIRRTLTPNTRVCSRHFVETDFVGGTNNRKLKKNAEPSLYLPTIPLVPTFDHMREPVHSIVADEENLQNTNLKKNEEAPKRSRLKDSSTQRNISETITMSWKEDCVASCSSASNLQTGGQIADRTLSLTNKRKRPIKNIFIVNVDENEKSTQDPVIMHYKHTTSDEEENALTKTKRTETCTVDPTTTIQALEDEVKYLKTENARLKKLSLPKPVFTLERFAHSDRKILFYTGFQTYSILKGIFQFVLPSGDSKDLLYDGTPGKTDKKRSHPLIPEDQFFLTLIRLRKGMSFETLGDLFSVSTAAAGKLFLTWINLLYLRLGSLDTWPSRDTLIKSAPLSVQKKYPNVIGSIDCTEFFVEKPSSLVRQSQHYSNYKGTTTVKSLIMTSPNGAIIYSSPLYSGSISDKAIINKSGFLDILKEKVESGNINEGDIILADKGFNVVNLFNDINLDLNIPVFRISGAQFTAEQVQVTRKVAQERIHVERAIARLKRFSILSLKIPVASLGTIEQIYHVCCWLTNFRFPLRNEN